MKAFLWLSCAQKELGYISTVFPSLTLKNANVTKHGVFFLLLPNSQYPRHCQKGAYQEHGLLSNIALSCGHELHWNLEHGRHQRTLQSSEIVMKNTGAQVIFSLVLPVAGKRADRSRHNGYWLQATWLMPTWGCWCLWQWNFLWRLWPVMEGWDPPFFLEEAEQFFAADWLT